MSVELPFAPVDTIIRRHADGLRVSAEAAERLAERIQWRGAEIAETAAERAKADGRKTIMASDFAGLVPDETPIGAADRPTQDQLTLPIAPVDRIARLDIDSRYRVGMEARIVLTAALEAYAESVAEGAVLLARHAGRRTIQAEDIETYFQLVE